MEPVSLNDLLGQISIGLDAVEGDFQGAKPFHSKRTALFSLAIGRQLGYDRMRLFTLAGCALLHDNALTQYLLSERPSPHQQRNLEMHCRLGEENCGFVPFPTPWRGIVQFHHECADGSGVFGLREGEFPEEAGIIALADKTDVRFGLNSLTEEGLEKARGFIQRKSGTYFSPKAAGAALEVLNEELLEKMDDSRIAAELQRQMPEVIQELSCRQLAGLSGITARIVDYKSRFTQEHTTQIANKAWYLARAYGYDEALRTEFYQAAALHDIGKLFVPTEILEKPGRLNDDEFGIIQAHALWTWKMLTPIRGFEKIANWASNHHEKLNGSGYPFGKKGEELDYNSRLLACLDIYQAVRELRPYHEHRSHDQAMKILLDMAAGGLVDERACLDLDRYLRELPEGNAPFPEFPQE